MSQTLPIYFKATGEHFDVSYRMQTTIYELIEYVCSHSVELSTPNPNDYYMAINNNDMLDDHQTVEETGLNQSNRFNSLTVCIKTRILIERILQSHHSFWQVPAENVRQKRQPASTIEKSGNIAMKYKRELF
jgi:hypothetical protein